MNEVPSWAISPEAQVEKAETFLKMFSDGDFTPADIPPTPRGVEGILLLTVFLPDQGESTGLQRTFDAWWQFATAPEGMNKMRWRGLESDPQHLRLASGYIYQPGIRWVIFKPDAYRNASPESALMCAKDFGEQLAGVEVLVALGMFEEWPLTWHRDHSVPYLSALQLHLDTSWADVPQLNWFYCCGESPPALALGAWSARLPWNVGVSPVVRALM